MSKKDRRVIRPSPRRILFGSEEPIFNALPERVMGNLHVPTSENALLWNLIYPLAQPKISLLNLLRIRPIWGTSCLLEMGDEKLMPYFWGYSIDGDRLQFLDTVLETVDGPGLKTEVDLFLLGEQHLVVVEAKHAGGLGRCSRFMNRRCPEIHLQADGDVEVCRYWEDDSAHFGPHLDFGPRPVPGGQFPSCYRHYQLARTLLVGYSLSIRLHLQLHLWLIVPRDRWRSFEQNWLDFTERVRDDKLWRRLRVVAWEDVRELREDLIKRV